MHMCKCANLTFQTIQIIKKIHFFTFYYKKDKTKFNIIFIGQHNKKIPVKIYFGQEYAKIIIV